MNAHATLQFRDAVGGRYAGRLRQHAHTDEIAREQRTHAVDHFVARRRPCLAGGSVAQMVTHAGRSGGENRDIGAALALQAKLTVDDRLADFVIADGWPRRRRSSGGMFRDLLPAPLLMLFRRRRVMAMTVDDHLPFTP